MAKNIIKYEKDDLKRSIGVKLNTKYGVFTQNHMKQKMKQSIKKIKEDKFGPGLM